MSGGGLGEEHDRGRCGPCAECLTREAQAAAAKDQNQRAAQPDGDPFAAVPWSDARYRFVSALDALAKVTVRRYPGAGARPDAERRDDERAIVEACAEVCAAVLPAWATSEGIVAIRAERDAAVEATEQARRERDAAERGRYAARSDLDNVRKKLWRALACHEIAAGKYATAEANLRDSRDRIARLEEDLAEYQKATASKTAAEAQETIVRLAGRIDVGQAALEQATSERDAALRSWEALRDQLAAAEAEAATEQARAERDAAEQSMGPLRHDVANIRGEICGWKAATGQPTPGDAEALLRSLEKDRAALRSRVADLEAEILAWRNATWSETPDDATAAIEGRVKDLERGIAEARGSRETLRLRVLDLEARLVALDVRSADEPDSLAAVRRDFAAEIRRRDERLEALLVDVADHERGIGRLARLLSEIDRRLAPKPDTLSKCEEPPAEPRVGEAWEDSEGGEQGRIVTRIEAADGPCWDAAVVKPSRGNHSPIGARIVVSGPPRWHRVPSEQDARAALREEVAALCDAAGWPGCAAGIRSGNAARIYLQPRPAATTEATRNALAALDALAEAERPLAALWEHVAVLCERAGRPHAARELRRGRSVSDVLSMVRAAREWTHEVRAAISALEKLDNASGSAHVAPGSIGPGTPEEQDRMRECPKNAIHPLQAAGFRCSCGYEGVA